MNGSHAPERRESPHERLSIALPGSLRDRVLETAARHERSVSAEVRRALRRHLKIDDDEEER